MSDSELPDGVDQAAEDQMAAAMDAIDEAGADDRPDPSEVGAASKEEVLNQRSDGDLITEEKVVETSDGWRTMEFKRPTATLIQWFESQGEDIDTGAFAEVYARMIVDPDLSPDEWLQGDLTAYVDLIQIVMTRMEGVLQSEFVSSATETLDERASETTGN